MSEPIRILQWGMTTGLGGLVTFLMNLYRNIDRTKVQFDFLQAHDEGHLVYEQEILELGGNVYRVVVPQRESFSRSRSCMRDFFVQHPYYAGVHVNANFRYADPLKYAKEAGIGLRILHSHQITESHAHTDPLHQVLWALRTGVVQHQIDTLPTHYFACSDMAARFMFPGKPFTWIKNGIDTKRFAYDDKVRKEVRQRLGLDAHTKVIGFCAHLIVRKNPLFALDVFREYHHINPDSKFMMVGEGNLRDQVEQRVAEYNLTDAVMMLGQRQDADRLYQAMDAFVLPALAEGLGIVYIEAQCAGLPCLASASVVPKAADITDLMHFVPLTHKPQIWAKQLDQAMQANAVRRDHSLEVRKAGFEMKDVAAGLQEFYLANATTTR